MQIGIKTFLITIVCVFIVAYTLGYIKKTCKDTVIATGTATVKTGTEVKYIPKAPGEKTDLDVNIGKPQIAVKVNGKETTFKKADNEKYALDKNKIALNQESKVEFEIKTNEIDNTKDWAIGAGYGNHGVAGMINFPLLRPFGGWAYGDSQTAAAGGMIKFNWR